MPGAEPSSPQQTLARPISFTGVGLMLGVEATLVLRPAEPNSGIRFRRTDLEGRPEIPLPNAEIGTPVQRATGVSYRGVTIQTVEHVLSALAGMGVDNALLDLSGPEPPILDGSALPFAQAIQETGLVPQSAPRRYLQPTVPVALEREDRQVALFPAEDLQLTFVFDRYGRPGVSSQVVTFPITPEVYLKEIAPARTFCFEDEVEALRAAGLGRGATEENVLIIGPEGPRNGDYRLPDELARHKLLDLLGDLYLAGRPLRGHVLAVRSQHALNVAFVRKLLETKEGQDDPRTVKPPVLTASEIERILPHRYPFLLVDRVLELEENRRIRALKNVTINEEFFRGHFPGHPVMPGVLITEALAQAGGVLLMRNGNFAGKIAYFMTIEEAKFRKPVLPGDQLILDVEILRLRRATGRLRGEARVDGQLVAEAEFTFAIVEREE